MRPLVHLLSLCRNVRNFPMAILIDRSTTVIIQGITGKEGQRAAEAMRAYGTHIVAGVRPGKGGERVGGIPVFDTVRAAFDAFPTITASVVVVPPAAARDAVVEAIAAGVVLVNVLVERMPIRDAAWCIAAARERGVRLLGPSSLGIIVPGVGRLGVIGGSRVLADEIFASGDVGVISRSGGMTNEVSWQLRRAGFGQSAAVHVGGDLLIGTTYRDLLALFARDPATRAVVLVGEHGGAHEFEVADAIAAGEFMKPLAAYIGGAFASRFPIGMQIGHAGAIVERGRGVREKEAALAAVGVRIAERYDDLPALVVSM